MAKKSSKLNINGKSVTVETELENGAYTVKDSKGRIIGSGDSASGGNINFSGGDSTAQKELLGLSGSRSRNLNKDLQSKVKGAVENENKAILNKNASTTQKLNLRDMGYGDKLDIKGVTTPAEPDIDTTPAPSEQHCLRRRMAISSGFNATPENAVIHTACCFSVIARQ